MGNLFARLYEGQLFGWLPALYKANPCDIGALKFFRHLSPYFERLTSGCPCCAGARVFFAALLGAAFPTAMLWLLAVYAVLAVLLATIAALNDEAETP